MSKYVVDNAVVDAHKYLDSDHYKSTLTPDIQLSTTDSLIDVGYTIINLSIHMLLLCGLAIAVYQLATALWFVVKFVLRGGRRSSVNQHVGSESMIDNEKKNMNMNNYDIESEAAQRALSSSSSGMRTPELTHSPDSEQVESFPSSPELQEQIKKMPNYHQFQRQVISNNNKDRDQQHHNSNNNSTVRIR